MNSSFLIAAAAVLIVLAVAAVFALRKLGARRVPAVIGVGQALPSFRAQDENGNELSSDSLRGQPTVVLFVRGNWCPFCSRQVANLTKHYKSINDLGARLILVTPKPLETTRRVAEFFNVDFEFWLDENLAIARQLGLVQNGGVPGEHRGEYGEDTVWPASLVTDSEGVIRFSLLSKMIADRPNPQRFVQVLQSL